MAAVARLVLEGGAVVCERCAIAATALSRMRGLLGRSELPRDEGLYIRPASSVHTWFMRFPIDVVFVDEQLVVLKVVPELPPWRMTGRRGAKATFELSSGEAARRGVVVGVRLELVS